MNVIADPTLCSRIALLRSQHPEPARVLAIYAASVARCDEEAMTAALGLGRERNVNHRAFYEIALQSYLFLGFPRMLIALERLDGTWSGTVSPTKLQQPGEREVTEWTTRGLNLCKTVYGDAFEPLRSKVLSLSPEAFQWMVTEGYGKVLSRPELGSIERELANVAFLTIENYDSQLYSHIRGALRVGAAPGLLATIIHDLGGAAGDGYQSACTLLERLGIS